MGNVTDDIPKPLISIMGEPLLFRTTRQLRENGLNNITVVTGYKAETVQEALSSFPGINFVLNEKYLEDKNILSLILGIKDPEQSFLVIEGDVVFSNAAASFLATMTRMKSSAWAACGSFRPGQIGGIMRSDANGNMQDLRYVPSYAPEWQGYLKNLGAIFIHKKMAPSYFKLLQKAAAGSIDQYFMEPWMRNLASLPAKVLDFGSALAASFNTEAEYQKVCDIMDQHARHPAKPHYQIEMIDVKALKHIEAFSPSRVSWLRQKIVTEGYWTQPICVDDKHAFVMDGQHRMEVALALGLRCVPAMVFSYDEVEVWSLRPRTHAVTTRHIIKRSLAGNIYPYKTAKHKFPIQIQGCNIPLEDLK